MSNCWRALKIPFINCEINLIPTWLSTCVITISTGAGTFGITDTKFYVPVVILSNQNNAKILEQLKHGCKRTFNLNKYQSKVSIKKQNQYLDYLLDPRILNGLFVLSFKYSAVRTGHTICFLAPIEIKDCNVMIEGQRFFDQPIKKDYSADCLLDYPYFKKYYKMIAIDLSKQQAFDADPNQYGNLILQEI